MTFTQLSLCTLSLLFAGCSPESETLKTLPQVKEQTVEIPQYDPIPAQEFKWMTEDGGQSQFDFNPRIDLLFVVDNSESMRAAQENLRNNIHRFAEGLLKNRMIDFHIGVISIWDQSERAIRGKKDTYQIGDLRFVKNSQAQSFNKRFLDRKTASLDLLASTLYIGVAPYAQGGPEIEEFFSPLVAALEKSGPQDLNAGFFRAEAELVVIFMTDADDSTSRMSPEQMAQMLFEFKKGNRQKVSVYGVLVRAEDPDSVKDWDLRVHPRYRPECFDGKGRNAKNNGKCTGFGPERLEQLIVSANPDAGTPAQIKKKFIIPLTSPRFGENLAQIGSDITAKLLRKTIYLSQRPRFDQSLNQIMIRVRYGTPEQLQKGQGQLIPAGESGWLYNPDENSVELSGRNQYQFQEGARFAVDLIPLTLKPLEPEPQLEITAPNEE
jgi:hypothetical protein